MPHNSKTNPVQLSVIVPTCSSRRMGFSQRRAQVERAIHNLVSAQTEEMSFEVVLIQDSASGKIADHVETVFSEAILANRLFVHRMKTTGDFGRAINEGAKKARGSYLAFVDPLDHWEANYVGRIAQCLTRNEFILLCRDRPENVSSGDWLRSLILENRGQPSSAVVRRTLFDKVGGFPVGNTGLPIPRGIPGNAEYEFWLRCLIELSKQKRLHHFQVLSGNDVRSDSTPPSKISAALQSTREVVTLLKLSRKVPKSYLPDLTRRILSSGRGIFKSRVREIEVKTI